jgi:hypothetical protein
LQKIKESIYLQHLKKRQKPEKGRSQNKKINGAVVQFG